MDRQEMIKTLIENQQAFGTLEGDPELLERIGSHTVSDGSKPWVVGYRFFEWGVTYTLAVDKDEIKASNTMSYEKWEDMSDSQIQRLYNLS